MIELLTTVVFSFLVVYIVIIPIAGFLNAWFMYYDYIILNQAKNWFRIIVGGFLLFGLFWPLIALIIILNEVSKQIRRTLPQEFS